MKDLLSNYFISLEYFISECIETTHAYIWSNTLLFVQKNELSFRLKRTRVQTSNDIELIPLEHLSRKATFKPGSHVDANANASDVHT